MILSTGVFQVLVHRVPLTVKLTHHVVFRTVNLRSVYLGCKFACVQFLKQDLGPSGHRGWIVNTSSILGVVGFRDGARKTAPFPNVQILRAGVNARGSKMTVLKLILAAYCASKAAVINLTKQVAIDYAPHRIHCNALCPGCKQLPS